MIKQVSKLKQFGIFHDFVWTACPEFRRFNLIYGWNRSGKTTLSRVLSACEKRSVKFKRYPEYGKFEVKTSTGAKFTNEDIASCNIQIKVFNSDFIEDNVSFDPESSCNPIVYISEEDIESKKELEELHGKKPSLVKALESAKTTKRAQVKQEENFRRNLAQTIASHNTQKHIHDYYFSYTRDKIEKRISDKGLDGFSTLTTSEFEKCKKVITSDVKHLQRQLTTLSISLKHSGKIYTAIDGIETLTRELLSREVVADTIKRLKDDHDLNHWVKQGYDLHIKQKADKCLFCEKELDPGFLDSLAKHYSKDYEELQADIDNAIIIIESAKQTKQSEKNADLYSDLQSDYTKTIKKLNASSNRLNKWLDDTITALRKKHRNPLSKVSLPKRTQDPISEYNTIVSEANAVISDHNDRVNNHDEEVGTAKEKVEYHLIARAISEQNYEVIKQELDNAISDYDKAAAALSTVDDEIAVLERKTSDIGNALVAINKHLEEFFGRKEIQLELDDDKKGYIINRNGKAAKNLSEGEKTAIAFSYFIVKVKEKDFNQQNGIIFIDDPVSSFDSNFVYHCFSVITNNFGDVGQLFIATHNFELFNLTKEWLLNKSKSVARDNRGKADRDKKELPAEFYMVENYSDNGKRYATFVELEETLKNFKSEYHYLFSLLRRFAGRQKPHYDDYYIIGNIARRFLEIFAGFKIPRIGDLRGKINDIVKSINKDKVIISNTERDKVYKLIQEFSHGYDPTSVIEHKDKAEIKDAVEILLRIIENADAMHYKLLANND